MIKASNLVYLSYNGNLINKSPILVNGISNAYLNPGIDYNLALSRLLGQRSEPYPVKK